MRNWFLYRVYKLNKKLFVFLLFFLAGTFITNFSGWEATPFFVWGMYSKKEDSSNTRPVLKITINDSAVINYPANYSDANKFFLTSPLQLYILMKKNNVIDPTAVFLKNKMGKGYSKLENISTIILNGKKEYEDFLPWYKRYLEQTTGIRINSYTIELINARYSDKYHPGIFSTELIDTWRQ